MAKKFDIKQFKRKCRAWIRVLERDYNALDQGKISVKEARKRLAPISAAVEAQSQELRAFRKWMLEEHGRPLGVARASRRS